MMDRAELGFASSAATAFGFLQREFGFRLVESTPTRVRFETDRLFLNVYHGRQSYEIGVEVGVAGDPTVYRYGLPDVLGALAEKDPTRQTYFQASSPDAIRSSLATIADLVARVYPPVFVDRTALQRIDDYTRAENTAYTRQVVQQPVRDAADAAWRADDYATAARLYESISDGLTAVERRRLDYARRHAG